VDGSQFGAGEFLDFHSFLHSVFFDLPSRGALDGGVVGVNAA
jgi:hypothetical protein